MMLGVIHYNTPGNTVEEFLKWAAFAGFESVELAVHDVWPDKNQCGKGSTEEVAAMLKQFGLKCSALASGNDFVVLEPAAVEAQVARMKCICELAQLLDCNVIRTEGGQPKDSVPQEKWVEAMAACCTASLDFLKPMGMKYAIDNHGYVTNDIGVMMGLLKAVDAPGIVGSNLDTMNVRWFGNTLEQCDQFYRDVAPWVLHTHMKDGTGSRETYHGRDLGNGEINLALALQCLKDAGYDYAYTAEYEGKEDRAIGYEKCLVWMKHKI